MSAANAEHLAYRSLCRVAARLVMLSRCSTAEASTTIAALTGVQIGQLRISYMRKRLYPGQRAPMFHK